jgi:hypothetical protein
MEMILLNHLHDFTVILRIGNKMNRNFLYKYLFLAALVLLGVANKFAKVNEKEKVLVFKADSEAVSNSPHLLLNTFFHSK